MSQVDPEPPPTEIVKGDCIDEMREMDADSVHAVVTDPPYNFEGGFMGQEWDDIGSPKEYQQWCEAWASEVLRVLKPGGHLIAFSSTKAYHRLVSGVEDAGFTVRDQLDWLHGQGFPKGATPAQWMDGEDAETWDGWKSELKPAHEPAVLARAPLSESSIYRNVLEHGTGALNIGRTRIPIDNPRPTFDKTGEGISYGDPALSGSQRTGETTTEGRHPANVILDTQATRLIDEETGQTSQPCGSANTGSNGGEIDNDIYGDGYTRTSNAAYVGDSGGPSRFFYTAKASPSERSINGQAENNHSTVKPLELMEWLVTLVTAPGQKVLDPFTGSGTTIMACKRLDREGVGIEMDDEYAEVARERVELAHEVETDFNAPNPTPDGAETSDEPATLESFGDD